MRMLRDTVMVGVHKIYVETWSSDCYIMLYIVYRLCRDTVTRGKVLYIIIYRAWPPGPWVAAGGCHTLIHTHANIVNIRYNIYHLDHYIVRTWQ